MSRKDRYEIRNGDQLFGTSSCPCFFRILSRHFWRAVSKRLGPRTLLLYGVNDHLVERESTIALWRRLADKGSDRPVFALYDEGWHLLMRDLQALAVWEDILAWIEDPRAPLASGADGRAQAAIAAGG